MKEDKQGNEEHTVDAIFENDSAEGEGETHNTKHYKERIFKYLEEITQLVSGEMLSEIKQEPDYLLKIQRNHQVVEAVCVKKITINNLHEHDIPGEECS